MVLLIALAAATASPAQPRVAPARAQAMASIRILSAAPLRFSQIEAREPKTLRDSVVRSADGSTTPVRIVEFH